MSESLEDSVIQSPATAAVTAPTSLDVPSNKYSDLLGVFPPELFEGFEEFVKECRRESGFGQEPPSWW